MRLIFVALLLAFAVFFTSIELSSQSSNSSRGSRGSNVEYSGEEVFYRNEQEGSDSESSRTGTRHFGLTRPEDSEESTRHFELTRPEDSEESRESGRSSLRQRNANRRNLGNRRPQPPRILLPHEASTSRAGERFSERYERQRSMEQQRQFRQQEFEQGYFGQQGHFGQHQRSPSESPQSFDSQSPRGPLSFHNDFTGEASESGSSHVSPHEP